MAKKRKSMVTNLDEVDRTMYATFCSGANSLSQLYTQAMNHQKLSFQAGERHGLEKLYQWILRQQEAGSRVAPVDIMTYLKNELDYYGDETTMSPRAPVQHHHPPPPTFFSNSGLLVSEPSAQTPAAQLLRPEQENQSKSLVFSNALSSPIRRSLQPYHLAQGGYYPNSSPGTLVARSSETNFAGHQNRESNSNDSSMDMHQDSPGPESNY
ncbi:uncharacterized protein LOC141605444 [Silene latifolia]|uniref:uncharacterized protein LOC141605444 n=1 Tax=Silene latifolia TaxID=37657 RepID=UPI003D76B9CC